MRERSCLCRNLRCARQTWRVDAFCGDLCATQFAVRASRPGATTGVGPPARGPAPTPSALTASSPGTTSRGRGAFEAAERQ